MDNETKDAIARVVEYLYIDEEKNFIESGEPEEHIFRDIMFLGKIKSSARTKCFSMVHSKDIKEYGHCLECQKTK